MTLQSNEHTHKDKIAEVTKTYNTYMIEAAKALSYKQHSVRFIFHCPYAVYMYKIMILLNTFSSEISWPISTKFHVDPTVERGLKVCSNGHAPLILMPIYGKMMIIKTKNCSNDDPFFSCNDRIGKWCITSAYLQWLFHSGEKAMARGPLVLIFLAKKAMTFYANCLLFSKNKKTYQFN